MRLTTKGFAKWVGAVAIGVMGTLAQAAIVVDAAAVDFPAHTFVPSGSTTNTPFSEDVTGLVSGNEYRLLFAVKDSNDLELPALGSLSVEIGDILNVLTATAGSFDFLFIFMSGDLEKLVFTYSGSDAGIEAIFENVQVLCDEAGGCRPVTQPPGNNAPEPGSLLLVGAALAAGAWVRRKKPA